MKYAKRIAAFICVIAIFFTLVCAPYTNASGTPLLGGQQFGALIASGLLSLNIIANTALQSAPIQKLWEWCSSPTAEDRIDYLFPVLGDTISDYLNASTIKVNQGVVTIDGVEYDDLWISPGTFTDGLKTDIFDFKTKWAILSGQAGTLATGAGYMMGEPVYRVEGVLRTRTYKLNTPGGSRCGFYSGGSTQNPGSSFINWEFYYNNGSLFLTTQTQSSTNYLETFGSNFGGTNWTFNAKQANGIIYKITRTAPESYIEQPFQFDYISGVVPAEKTDIPEDYGLSLKIPHDKLETFYNTYPQYNVDNSVININQDQIDINELTQAIFDQITSMDEILAEWKAEEEPEPPGPVPPGPAEDVLTGVNTIIGQQNTQISQNQQDLQIQQQQLQQQQQQLQQQQQISQDTSDISQSIKDATAMPDAEQLPDFKFDLRELFPFCIPFDIYRLLTAFDAEPVAPHVQIPFVIQSLNFSYNIDLDFSVFNPVAQVLRTVEFIVYALGLAWATGKVIKW